MARLTYVNRETLCTTALLPILPITDKYSRAVAVTPVCEAGRVSVLFGPWNDKAIDQLCDFNALLDTPDDIVDCFSQAMNYFKPRDGKPPPIITKKIDFSKRSKILERY